MEGQKANPRIVEYLRTTTLSPSMVATDETAWCAAFVNWGIELTAPRPGCVVVLKRDENKGHVGFFTGREGKHLRILGGNQVRVSSYSTALLLGYRGLAL